MGMGELRKKKIYIDQINFGDDSQNGTKNDFKNKETRKEKKKNVVLMVKLKAIWKGIRRRLQK